MPRCERHAGTISNGLSPHLLPLPRSHRPGTLTKRRDAISFKRLCRLVPWKSPTTLSLIRAGAPTAGGAGCCTVAVSELRISEQVFGPGMNGNPTETASGKFLLVRTLNDHQTCRLASYSGLLTFRCGAKTREPGRVTTGRRPAAHCGRPWRPCTRASADHQFYHQARVGPPAIFRRPLPELPALWSEEIIPVCLLVLFPTQLLFRQVDRGIHLLESGCFHLLFWCLHLRTPRLEWSCQSRSEWSTRASPQYLVEETGGPRGFLTLIQLCGPWERTNQPGPWLHLTEARKTSPITRVDGQGILQT